MNRQLPRLHAITNDEVLALPDFYARASQVATMPATALHIRSGSLDGRRLTCLAASLQPSTESGSVFVNDRADVASIVGATGLHLPAAGLSIDHARSIVGSACWIGRSTHTADEVIRAADEGADYVFLGPIWTTPSHPDTQPLGPGVLAVDTSIPVIAIGGIAPKKVQQCLEKGAYGVAVISALWNATSVASTVRDLSLSFPP